jgi:hypothetical protein
VHHWSGFLNPRPDLLNFQLPIPRLGETWSPVSGGQSEYPAMIRKVSNVEIVVPTVLAVALAIVLSIGAIYLPDKHLVPVDYSVAGSGGITDVPNPDGRLSRVHLLLSGIK